MWYQMSNCTQTQRHRAIFTSSCDRFFPSLSCVHRFLFRIPPASASNNDHHGQLRLIVTMQHPSSMKELQASNTCGQRFRLLAQIWAPCKASPKSFSCTRTEEHPSGRRDQNWELQKWVSPSRACRVQSGLSSAGLAARRPCLVFLNFFWKKFNQ